MLRLRAICGAPGRRSGPADMSLSQLRAMMKQWLFRPYSSRIYKASILRIQLHRQQQAHLKAPPAKVSPRIGLPEKLARNEPRAG